MQLNGAAGRRRTFLLVLGLLAVAACSDDAIRVETPPDIALEPQSGPPGTLVRLDGVPGAEDPDATFEVAIAGESQVAARDEDDQLLAYVPALGSEDAGWPESPGAPVDVVILRDGEVVATLAGALEILPLEPAPEVLDDVVADLTVLHQGMIDLLGELSSLGGEGDAWSGYALAFEHALTTLVDPTDEQSLAHQVSLMTDQERSLVGAVLAASPLPDHIEALAALSEAAFPAVVSPLHAPVGVAVGAPARAGVIQIDDAKLAFHMQLRAIYQATAGGYYQSGAGASSELNRVAAYFGMTEVLQRFRLAAAAAAVIGAYFTIHDIFVNDVMVPMMPGNIERLEVALDDTELTPGQEVGGTFEITVTNTPGTITLGQIVNSLLSVLGAVSGGGAPTTSVLALDRLASHLLGEVQSALTDYAQNHPDAGVDFAVVRIPLRTWHAVIDDPTLVALLSRDEDLIARTGPDVLTWTASEDETGETQVEYMPSTEPEALFFGPLSGTTTLQLGAFGTELTTSNLVGVRVAPELDLVVTFPATIEAGVPAELVIEARYLPEEGEPVAAPGVDITLDVAGGTLSATDGTTDQHGVFRATAELGVGELTLTIQIHAEDESGATAEAFVERTSDIPPGVRFLLVSFGAMALADVGGYVQDIDEVRPTGLQSMSASANATDTNLYGDDVVIEASASGSGSAGLALEDGMIVAQGQMRGSISMDVGGSTYTDGTVGTLAQLYMIVQIGGEVPVRLQLASSSSFPGPSGSIRIRANDAVVPLFEDEGTFQNELTLSTGTYEIIVAVGMYQDGGGAAAYGVSGSFRIELDGPLVESPEAP